VRGLQREILDIDFFNAENRLLIVAHILFRVVIKLPNYANHPK
jgi:hypothetical protein